MKPYDFLEPAQDEFLEAVAYSNKQRTGLGAEFAEEVYRTIGRILRNPATWAKFSRRTRRCRTKRFPYAVIYQIKSDMILIVAVMHLSRRPGYWRDRLRPN